MQVLCAGAVIVNSAGELLLVRRGQEPGMGLYSVPGGRVEPGETLEMACAREVLEECGLKVAVGRPLGQVERSGPGGVTFDITDFACTVTGGHLQAGDDAGEVRWVPLDRLADQPLVTGLLDALRLWGVVG